MRSAWRFVALLVALAACGGRPLVLGQAEGTAPGGAYVRVTRLAVGDGFASFGGGSYLTEGRRYYTEPRSREYSGYEVRTRDLGNGQLAVYFLKLGAPVAEGTYRQLALPRPRVLGEGEAFEIELYRGAGGRRLYDRMVLYRRKR